MSDRRLRRLAGVLGYLVPEISSWHDWVARLPAQRFADFNRRSAVRRLGKAKWKVLFVDGIGFEFTAPLTQAWRPGSQVRQVHAHIQVVAVAAVSPNRMGVAWGALGDGVYR